MPSSYKKLKLKFNPFEPAANGAPLADLLWIPDKWRRKLQNLLNPLSTARGVKAIAISGEYGSGKSYILQWLARHEFLSRRIKAYYFDNPGVQFYDLANSLLRQIGRKEFAKSVWELAGSKVSGYQRSLFASGFEEYLGSQRRGRLQVPTILTPLQAAIIEVGITSDEEIAHRLARIVAETPKKPFFEYRDFVVGKADAYVAEREEAPYFGAILKTLRLAADIEAVAFLIDEFEEISLQKMLSRREAQDYLATLKRLINLTQEEDLWVVLTMTKDGVQKTKAIEPALWERLTGEGKYHFAVPPLTAAEAKELVRFRLDLGRLDPKDKGLIFPFPDDLQKAFSPAIISTPRKLVKTCFYALSEGVNEVKLPFALTFLQKIENTLYPLAGQEAEP